MTDQRGPTNGWHVDKSISVGHMVSTVMLFAALVAFVMTTNTKIEVTAARVDSVESRIDRAEVTSRQDAARLHSSLTRIEDKLDRFIERTKD